jgi:hypothetical protein
MQHQTQCQLHLHTHLHSPFRHRLATAAVQRSCNDHCCCCPCHAQSSISQRSCPQLRLDVYSACCILLCRQLPPRAVTYSTTFTRSAQLIPAAAGYTSTAVFCLMYPAVCHSQSSTSQRSCTLPCRTKRLHAPSLSSAWQQQQQQQQQHICTGHAPTVQTISTRPAMQ